MSIIYNFFFNRINLLNFLIALTPLSIILGNLAININIFLIIITGILIFGTKIFILEKKLLNYLIYFFFFYLLLITFSNNWNLLNENFLYKENIIKSIFYLRFLLLFLVINKLIENNNFNIRFFFISSAFFSIIISIDIFIQFFLKKNIIGFEISKARPSSFFNEENIAGGFVQRFALFFICIFGLNTKYNENPKSYFYITILTLFFISILLSGNKMPLFIFLSTILFFFILEKNYSALLLSLFLTTILIFFSLKIILPERMKINLHSFLVDSVRIIKEAPQLFIYNKNKNIKNFGHGYIIHFNTGIQIWKENKVFGNGLKSFKLKCSYEPYQTCNTHPHNYVIEIMVDTGLIGLGTIYLILILGIINYFKKYYNDYNIRNKFIGNIIFLLIFFELFPIRSTGSFFTTGNSFFIFLILPIFLNLDKLHYNK